MWDIQLFKLNYDQKEVDAVSNVVSGGWLTMGERINDFEVGFANFLGEGTFCSAVSNGTAALHLALLALDIERGDEVIIPALTFVADANVVYSVGASPILADCKSPDDWNISLESIKKVVTKKTKAIIVVHYAGYPCSEIKEISDFCNDNGIRLIEDVAHAPGAKIHGRSCGTFGDIGCFSFFSNKNLSIGEGGMLSTLNKDIDTRLRFLRSHGMTSLTLDRHKGRSITYDISEPGLNYRMDEMRAALGLVQLKKLADGNAKRKNFTNRYRENFSETSIKMPFITQPESSESVYHILPILLPHGTQRINIINFLKEKRIQSSIHYPPFWDFKAYSGDFNSMDTPFVKEIAEYQLTLPLYPTMTIDDVDKVSSEIIKAIK
jgi:dTDP-4-amino-4,6-dideoxygalactose transaminase